MARLPTKFDLSGPASLRSGRPIAQWDGSGYGRGLAALGAGLQNAGSGVSSAASQVRRDNIVLEGAGADGGSTKELYDFTRGFDSDPDYGTFGARFDKGATAIRDKWAAKITDPNARQTWMLDFDKRIQSTRNGVLELGEKRVREGKLVDYKAGLEGYQSVIADADVSDEERQRAKDSANAWVDAAAQAGLLTPSEADEWRQKVIEGGEFVLGQRMIERDPSAILGTPVPANILGAIRDVESSGNSNAVSPAGAVGSMQIMPETAAEIAREIGDENFPATVSEQQAYLKRDDVSRAYGEHYFGKMLQRYNGDADAALVAYNGGSKRADEWIAAGKDDSVLPKETADYYKKVMAKAGQMPELPIVTKHQDGRVFAPDMSGVVPQALDRFKQLQNAFGESVPVVSGYRDPERNKRAGGAQASRHTHGDAFDLDVSDWSREKKLRLIQTASAAGFTGIGVYGDGNSIHIDLGARRAWGRSRGYDSVPSWAKAVVDDHLAGKFNGRIGTVRNRPSWYTNQSPDNQLRLENMAAARQGELDRDAAARAKAERDGTNDTFRLRIAAGDPTLLPGDILGDTRLDNGQKATLLNTYNEKYEESIRTGLDIQVLQGGALSLNPFDNDDNKRADNLYDTLMKSVEANPGTMEPAAARQYIAESIVRSGVVPKGMMDMMRAGVQSTNTADVVAALQQAQRISQINPAALGRRDGGGEVQSAADDFSYYVNGLNLTPEEAARRIMDARDPATIRTRKALEPLAKDFLKTAAEADIADMFDPGMLSSEPALGFNAEQEAGIKADFLAIAEDQFYRANGDPELALNRAEEQMKRLYGATNVTGRPVLMKHPPEYYWPRFRITQYGKTDYVGGEPSLDYAVGQLRQDLSKLYPNVDMGKVSLITTPETDAMVKRGDAPGYAVIYQDENGTMQTIPGKLWMPDFKAVQERVAPIEEKEKLRREDAARRHQGMIKDLLPSLTEEAERFRRSGTPGDMLNPLRSLMEGAQ